MAIRKIAFIEVEESQIFHEGTFKWRWWTCGLIQLTLCGSFCCCFGAWDPSGAGGEKSSCQDPEAKTRYWCNWRDSSHGFQHHRGLSVREMGGAAFGRNAQTETSTVFQPSIFRGFCCKFQGWYFSKLNIIDTQNGHVWSRRFLFQSIILGILIFRQGTSWILWRGARSRSL